MVAGGIRQVVVLYRNDCMEICFGTLNIDYIIEVVIWAGFTV